MVRHEVRRATLVISRKTSIISTSSSSSYVSHAVERRRSYQHHVRRATLVMQKQDVDHNNVSTTGCNGSWKVKFGLKFSLLLEPCSNKSSRSLSSTESAVVRL